MTKTLRMAASALALSLAAFAVAPAAQAQQSRGFTAKEHAQVRLHTSRDIYVRSSRESVDTNKRAVREAEQALALLT